MPDRLPSLILLAAFWIPPAIVGWTAAKRARPGTRTDRQVRTFALLATFVVAWSAAWFLFQLHRMPPYIPGATHDPTYAAPEAVRWLAIVAGALVLPVSALACALAYRIRRKRVD